MKPRGFNILDATGEISAALGASANLAPALAHAEADATVSANANGEAIATAALVDTRLDASRFIVFPVADFPTEFQGNYYRIHGITSNPELMPPVLEVRHPLRASKYRGMDWMLDHITHPIFNNSLEQSVRSMPDELLGVLNYQGWLKLPALRSAQAGYVTILDKPTIVCMQSKRTTMRAGRFIKRFGCNPDGSTLSDEAVKRLVAVCTAEQTVLTLQFTKERKDYRKIYMNGPSSCMSYSFSDLHVDGENVHPAEVYAHPDNSLELAYVQLEDGSYAARAWVNTENKRYCTIYASNDRLQGASERMQELLEAAGYRDDARACMVDQQLLLIETDCGAIVCPYIDPKNMGVNLESDGMTVGGCNEADHETGCLEDYPPEGSSIRCDRCDERVHPDDTYEVLDYHGSDSTFCEGCTEYCTTGVECMETGDYLQVYENSNNLVETVENGTMFRGNGYGHYSELDNGQYEGQYTQDYLVDVDGGVWHVDDQDKLFEHELDWYPCSEYILNDEGEIESV